MSYVVGGLTNVQDGDLLFLQASSGGGTALVLPAGWTQIVASNGFQHNLLLAYRIWHTGDPTSPPTVTNAQTTTVSAYRDMNQATPFIAYNWWSSEVGGSILVTEANTLVIDTMFNQSLSTFTPMPPAAETKRYGQVNGGHGIGMGDTDGTAVPVGTWIPGNWTGFDEGTGTSTGAMVAFREVSTAAIQRWGFIPIRQGSGQGSVPAPNVLSMSVPGTSTNYASTPDSAANSITSGIDIRMKLTRSDWGISEGFAGKWGAAGQRSWKLRAYPTQIRFALSSNGTDEIEQASSVAHGISNGSTYWIRVTWAPNQSQYFKSHDGVSWTFLSAVAHSAAGIFDGTAPITVGDADPALTTDRFTGNVHYFELRNGVNGPVVQSFDPTGVTKTATRTPTTVTTGGPWTVTGSAWDWVT